MTHICVNNLTTIGSVYGLSPGRRHAIIWTNAGILLIGPLGTNFSEILIEIPTIVFKKMRLKVSSAKWRPSCLGLNVLRSTGYQLFRSWIILNRYKSVYNLHYSFTLIWRTYLSYLSLSWLLMITWQNVSVSSTAILHDNYNKIA